MLKLGGGIGALITRAIVIELAASQQPGGLVIKSFARSVRSNRMCLQLPSTLLGGITSSITILRTSCEIVLSLARSTRSENFSYSKRYLLFLMKRDLLFSLREKSSEVYFERQCLIHYKSAEASIDVLYIASRV